MSMMGIRHMRTAIKLVARLLAFGCLAIATLSAQQSAPAAPPKQVPGYVIGPNDVLRVTVYSGGVSQSEFRLSDYTVQTDGSITLPLLTKAVVVGGKSVADADAAIRKALLDARQFGDCNVDITVMGYHSSSIKIQGARYADAASSWIAGSLMTRWRHARVITAQRFAHARELTGCRWTPPA